MLKFKDYKYERPSISEIKNEVDSLIEQFNNSLSVEEQSNVMKKYYDILNEIETMGTLVSIRHSINTNDEFYKKENEFWNESEPLIKELNMKYYNALINSKFKDELQNKWGKYLFDIVDMELKTFSPDIIEDLVEENKLGTKYDELIASAKILFEGEERNLPQMAPFMQSKDRNIRKKAFEAITRFFKQNEDKFDSIYDNLVKVRDKIAKKLGFKNFVELGYARMGRTDYDSHMVANYRNQILKYIVPIASELKERQRKRLGLDKLRYYDESLKFLTGNAVPKGNSEWILENGKKMYSELSKETKEFFDFMVERELLDLVSRKGKMSGGYTTYLNQYKSPFIFSNFNGTSGDIDVLTHEAGHAFQMYSSRNIEVPEYIFPTMEACEIHSTSMEFFTWPWMKLFFEEDEMKYKFDHLSGEIIFMPYGATVDEFQHFVYENPNASKDERKEAWREIEKKYIPTRDYEDNDFLDKGTYWYTQGHIFQVPFYYIDYTLAGICALQFWVKMQKDREQAWDDYLTLCKVGGSKPFLQLVKLAKLQNPFEDGCIQKVMEPIKEWLDSINL